MRQTVRPAWPATLTRSSASRVIPFEPGSGPLKRSEPLYPLGCMKTLAPLPGTYWMMLFAGISANKSLPSRVQTGPSVHLSKPVATRSSLASGATRVIENGVELLNVRRKRRRGDSHESHEQETVDRHATDCTATRQKACTPWEQILEDQAIFWIADYTTRCSRGFCRVGGQTAKWTGLLRANRGHR